MALPVNGSTHLISTYYSFYRPRKDERLSWPSWLTYSGWITHISGHPSAAGRAQDRESSPARDRRSTTVPRHQLFSMDSHSFQRIWIRFGMRPSYNLRMVIFAEKPRDDRAAWSLSNASRRCSSYQRRPTVQQQTSDNDLSFLHFECTFCILGIFSKTGKSRVSHRVKMATR